MKNKITLEFIDRDEAEEWLAWYLDGGGEQQAEFYTDTVKSQWGENKDIILKLECFTPKCKKCKERMFFEEEQEKGICNMCSHYKKDN